MIGTPILPPVLLALQAMAVAGRLSVKEGADGLAALLTDRLLPELVEEQAPLLARARSLADVGPSEVQRKNEARAFRLLAFMASDVAHYHAADEEARGLFDMLWFLLNTAAVLRDGAVAEHPGALPPHTGLPDEEPFVHTPGPGLTAGWGPPTLCGEPGPAAVEGGATTCPRCQLLNADGPAFDARVREIQAIAGHPPAPDLSGSRGGRGSLFPTHPPSAITRDGGVQRMIWMNAICTWNARVPVGARIAYRADLDDTDLEARTGSIAYARADGQPMVDLQGLGPFGLEFVRALPSRRGAA